MGETRGAPPSHLPSTTTWFLRGLTAPCSCQTLGESAPTDLSSGITGTIPVEFSHGNESITTMAFVGQELSAVRAIR